MCAFLRIALVLSSLCSVQGTFNGIGWWMRQPYEKDSEFTLKAEYAKDYYVNCSGDFDVEFWVIPDLSIIDAVDNRVVIYRNVDDEKTRTEWYGDGEALSVKSLEEEQFGFYFCHGTDANGKRKVFKRAINYKGPHFADLWGVYRQNAIVAVSSSLAFLIIMTVSCFVYEWKFSDDFGRVVAPASIPLYSAFEGSSSTQETACDPNENNANANAAIKEKLPNIAFKTF